jgi:hypothetical protein
MKKQPEQPTPTLGETVVGAMMEARNLEGDDPDAVVGKIDPKGLRALAEKLKGRSRTSRSALLPDLQNLPSDPALGAIEKDRSRS